jgi:RimK family alpha-L-glutamate ligase
LAVDNRVPVFTDDPGWHGKRLQEAFAARSLETVFVSLKDCGFDFSDANQPGITIPGFSRLPRGVFVRGVPGGTVQQVIARLDILHALSMSGVAVYNDGRAIERTVDKAMTSFLLHRRGISTPHTWVCESRHMVEQIRTSVSKEGQAALVMKPLFGSQGMGIRKLEPGEALPVPLEQHVEGVYYLQQYINSGEGAWHDYRVFVIRGKAVAAMKRHGNGWVNNVALGGRCEAYEVDSEIAALAVQAADAVDIDYCGVDVICDADHKMYVLEVNSIPAWKGLQGVVGYDIAQLLVDDFLTRLHVL